MRISRASLRNEMENLKTANTALYSEIESLRAELQLLKHDKSTSLNSNHGDFEANATNHISHQQTNPLSSDTNSDSSAPHPSPNSYPNITSNSDPNHNSHNNTNTN